MIRKFMLLGAVMLLVAFPTTTSFAQESEDVVDPVQTEEVEVPIAEPTPAEEPVVEEEPISQPTPEPAPTPEPEAEPEAPSVEPLAPATPDVVNPSPRMVPSVEDPPLPAPGTHPHQGKLKYSVSAESPSDCEDETATVVVHIFESIDNTPSNVVVSADGFSDSRSMIPGESWSVEVPLEEGEELTVVVTITGVLGHDHVESREVSRTECETPPVIPPKPPIPPQVTPPVPPQPPVQTVIPPAPQPTPVQVASAGIPEGDIGYGVFKLPVWLWIVSFLMILLGIGGLAFSLRARSV